MFRVLGLHLNNIFRRDTGQSWSAQEATTKVCLSHSEEERRSDGQDSPYPSGLRIFYHPASFILVAVAIATAFSSRLAGLIKSPATRLKDIIEMKSIILSGIIFIIPLFVFGYQNPGTPRGFVNDFAGMLTIEQKQTLETKISSFEKETTNELSVVTVANLGGDTIENFAEKLFKDWGIGKNKKDNGVLLLISRDDRQMRIEVGYGLEGALTDAQSFWIIQNFLKPAFQKGDYYGGISGGIDNIISITKGEFEPDTKSTTSNGFNADSVFFFFWVAWVFFIWTGSVLARSKSWWGGGIVGGIVAMVVGFGFALVAGLVSAIVFIPLGLWLDYLVSQKYTTLKETNQPLPWWIGGRGGFGGRGGGGFGGFGGGHSGGGGSSGSW